MTAIIILKHLCVGSYIRKHFQQKGTCAFLLEEALDAFFHFGLVTGAEIFHTVTLTNTFS